MGFFKNLQLQGVVNQVYPRLVSTFEDEDVCNILALALAHACYPTATGNKDSKGVVEKLKGFPKRPNDPETAWKFVKRYIDSGSIMGIPEDTLFCLVWHMGYEAFLNEFITYCREDDEFVAQCREDG